MTQNEVTSREHPGDESSVANKESQDSCCNNCGTLAKIDGAVNPGLAPHKERTTDTNPKKARKAQRSVYTLFYLSIAGSLWAFSAYMLFPIEGGGNQAVRLSNALIGLGMALALFGIGLGAVHWAKTLMSNVEHIDTRHPIQQEQNTLEAAKRVFQDANEDSGFTRRSVIRNSLLGALIAFPLPGIMLLRGLAPHGQDPVELLSHTLWEKGTRLARDPSEIPIKAAEVTLGSIFHVIPEGLSKSTHPLEEKAKAAVILVRLPPDEMTISPQRKGWHYNGIIAYSKICTHVGCPVALYERQTHNLLCPCHQSQFDISDEAKVIFGPAKRPLPQLPITVDSEGYLIAQSDFTEPVGPSFWERS